MPYFLTYSRKSEKYLDDADVGILRRLEKGLAELRENPRGNNCKPLVGPLVPRWRKRIGDWRIVYTINDESATVEIEWISQRGEAYRR